MVTWTYLGTSCLLFLSSLIWSIYEICLLPTYSLSSFLIHVFVSGILRCRSKGQVLTWEPTCIHEFVVLSSASRFSTCGSKVLAYILHVLRMNWKGLPANQHLDDNYINKEHDRKWLLPTWKTSTWIMKRVCTIHDHKLTFVLSKLYCLHPSIFYILLYLLLDSMNVSSVFRIESPITLPPRLKHEEKLLHAHSHLHRFEG